MPSPTTVVARALHTALTVLERDALQDGLEFKHLWPRVLSADPRLEEDWTQVIEESPRSSRTPLTNKVGYRAIGLVKAGWLYRGHRRWQLTGLGRQALRDWPDAVDFYGEVSRRYRAWDGRKTRYQEAVETLAKLPDSAGWVDLRDLAGTFDVHDEILAGLLRGDRPPGWYLALGRGGEAGAGLPLLPYELDTWRQLLDGEGLLDEARSSSDTVRALPERVLAVDELLTLTGQGDPALAGDDSELPRQLWIIRGTDSSASVPLIRGPWRERSVVTLAPGIHPLPPVPRDMESIRSLVASALPATSPARRERTADELDAFLNRMREGDIVLSTDGFHTYVGFVRGGAVLETDRLERPVEWRNLDRPLDFLKDLPSGLSGVVQDSDSQVVEATDYAEAVLGLIGDSPRSTPAVEGPAVLPDATQELAASLHMPDTSWLQDCVELLRSTPQLIFHGPPGTGKTYTALALARHLAAASSATNVRLVQFHPAYAYEDFFEGIRPRLDQQDRKNKEGDAGELGYTLARGPLRKLADEAELRPAEVFVLVIDEINRGHLAKIFGELYFLLEYREERVHLLYGSDDGRGFRLPPNLYILGTMNTVDRSVAYMDAAMRRRFSFMELHPETAPVAGLLDSWLKKQAERQALSAGEEHDGSYDDSHARLLDEINRLLAESSPGDRSFRVGPSYLMQPLAHSGDGALERLWKTQIIPMLTEHHWGDGTDVETVYALDSLRDRLGIEVTTGGIPSDGAGADGSPDNEDS